MDTGLSFVDHIKEQSDEITEQLNDFIRELLLKVKPNNPIVTDGYQITFDFGDGYTEKPTKAKILINVVVKKPGDNTLQLLQANQIPAYIKLIRLGPVTYTVCDVPLSWSKDKSHLMELSVNPVSNTFDINQTKSLIDSVLTEMAKIYMNMRKPVLSTSNN
jgi:hypothetical protein